MKSLTQVCWSSLKVGWDFEHWHSHCSVELGRSLWALLLPESVVQNDSDWQSVKRRTNMTTTWIENEPFFAQKLSTLHIHLRPRHISEKKSLVKKNRWSFGWNDFFSDLSLGKRFLTAIFKEGGVVFDVCPFEIYSIKIGRRVNFVWKSSKSASRGVVLPMRLISLQIVSPPPTYRAPQSVWGFHTQHSWKSLSAVWN